MLSNRKNIFSKRQAVRRKARIAEKQARAEAGDDATITVAASEFARLHPAEFAFANTLRLVFSAARSGADCDVALTIQAE